MLKEWVRIIASTTVQRCGHMAQPHYQRKGGCTRGSDGHHEVYCNIRTNTGFSLHDGVGTSGTAGLAYHARSYKHVSQRHHMKSPYSTNVTI
jgi:hypothetical protein